MARETLLIVSSSFHEDVDLPSELLKRFYKVHLNDIPMDEIQFNEFSQVLKGHLYKDFYKSIHPNTLVFILSLHNKIAYFGVIHDILSREWSLELPTQFKWSDLIECAKQSSKSCISFN